jgi:hypothetical protein
LLNKGGLKQEVKAHQLLFGSLHSTFSCHFASQRTLTADALAHRMNRINMTHFFVTHTSREEALLFRVAYKMNRKIDGLDATSDTTAIVNVVESHKSCLLSVLSLSGEFFTKIPSRRRCAIEKCCKHCGRRDLKPLRVGSIPHYRYVRAERGHRGRILSSLKGHSWAIEFASVDGTVQRTIEGLESG